MQTPANSIVFDSLDRVPIPADVIPLLQGVDLDTQVWEAINLPVPGASYAIVGGKDLYLESDPNGILCVEKQDFTGELLFARVIGNNNLEGENSYLLFKAVCFHGELIGAVLLKHEKFPVKEYLASLAETDRQKKVDTQRLGKWWFRFIYSPFCISVWWSTSMAVRGLVMVRSFLVRLSEAVTPW
jgi:hypothetical protein